MGLNRYLHVCMYVCMYAVAALDSTKWGGCSFEKKILTRAVVSNHKIGCDPNAMGSPYLKGWEPLH